MRFTKKDLGFCVVTGIETGFIGWQVVDFLNVDRFAGLSFAWLIVIVPLAWIAGVNFGIFLGRFMKFMNQFGKFVAVGFTNFAVDSGVVNLLIADTGIATGFWFGIFKAVSFVVASVHSYFWNKFWVFDSGNEGNPASQFGIFFAVTVAAMVINVAVAYFVVNYIPAVFSLGPAAWANVGTVAGSAAALVFSFIGFRVVVFKKN